MNMAVTTVYNSHIYLLLNLVLFWLSSMRSLTRSETYSLTVLSAICLSILVNAWKSNGEPLFSSLAISGLAFVFCYALVLWTGNVFIKRGYKGRDMSKKSPVEM